MRFEDLPAEGKLIIFFVGIAVLLYVIYCVTKGVTYFHPRGMPEGEWVKREENPTLFWMAVGVMLVIGLFCVILSSFYIVSS